VFGIRSYGDVLTAVYCRCCCAPCASVQCETHGERLGVFGEMLEEEEKRLQAKVALQSLFSGKGSDQASEGKDDPPLTA